MNFDYNGIALIPIITLIIDVLKRAGLPNKFAAIVSIILGMIFGVFFQSTPDLKERILTGIIMGMSASGLYSSGKAVTKSIKNTKNK